MTKDKSNLSTAEVSGLLLPSKEHPAYIFHHFMKCGGTSVTRILHSWFNIVDDHFVSIDELEEYKKNRVDISRIRANDCIIGHYAYEGTYLHQRYPEIITQRDKLRAFTFLRDPLEFFVSFYYYSREHGRMGKSLEEFIASNRNLYAYYFPCEESDYKEVLDRYFFIGILERLQESMDKLAILFQKPRIEINALNRTQRDNQVSILTPEYVSKFKKDNELDYAIYENVISRFDAI